MNPRFPFLFFTILCLQTGLPLAADELLPRFVQDHCLACHGADDSLQGDIDLRALTGGSQPSNAKLLLKVVKVLDDREMPPAAERQPADQDRDLAVTLLREQLRSVLREHPYNAVPVRRMNRFQYNNAIIDLLELDREIFQLNERLMRRRDDYFHPAAGKMPDLVHVSSRPLSKDIDNQRPEGFRGVAAFPQDQRAEHGFDNQADHLTLSPLLMESFLTLSRSIAASPDLNAAECRTWTWLFAEPDAAERAGETWLRDRLTRLLRRAVRGPADPELLSQLTAFTADQLQQGQSTEQAMRNTLAVILILPEFLYLTETSAAAAEAAPVVASVPGRERVSDHTLAQRLSQFFWSSIPDEVLLDLADQGSLSEPEQLSAQIDRMLNDDRSARFCENFPAQWLQLDRLITAIPDPQQFPWFYYHGYRTSMHMMSEPLLLFETVFIEDRTVLDLLAPDFTWQSEMLRQNYEGRAQSAHEVQVQAFRRVPVEDARRGGVITNMAVMTMTSTPFRTQPITRGAWLNEVIFNDPPEPPPADVPPLPEVDSAELERLTIRERLSLHRERADCAACHNRIDPLGFALENYSPVGVWRDSYANGRDVDVSGTLFNRDSFSSVEEFKSLLIEQKHRFYRAFAGHLLAYGLGRELGPADQPALDQVTQSALDGNDSLRDMLRAVAMSEPFVRRNADPDAEVAAEYRRGSGQDANAHAAVIGTSFEGTGLNRESAPESGRGSR